MTILVLHIGTYKTGTTSIQNTLYQNSNLLFEKGINYLGHNSGGCSIKNGRQNFHNTLSPVELGRFIKSQVGDVHIYSNECLWDSKVVRNKLIPTIVDSKVYSRVLVIGYIRKQSEFIESFYKQEQGFGKRWAVGLSPQEFIKGLESRGTLNIYDTLSFFSGFFGKSNMLIRPYSRPVFHNSDVVEDFFGNDIFNGIEIKKPKQLNTSISPQEAIFRSLSYSLLSHTRSNSDSSSFSETRKMVNYFVDKDFSRFSDMFGEKIYSQEEKKMIDEKYLESNRKVELEYDLSFV